MKFEVEYFFWFAVLLVLVLIFISLNVTMIGVVNTNDVSLLGSNLSGFDGDFNRSFESGDPFRVVADGWVLQDGVDYGYNGSHIIFLNRIFDEHHISITS